MLHQVQMVGKRVWVCCAPLKKFIMDLELARKSLWIWMTQTNKFMDAKMQNKSLWTSSALFEI
jgi:hypothetical protein